MESLNLDLRINRIVNLDIDIHDVLEGINELPMTRRWNYVAHLINNIETDIKDLTDEQKEITKKYLESKLATFKK